MPYAPFGACDIDLINIFAMPRTSQKLHIEGFGLRITRLAWRECGHSLFVTATATAAEADCRDRKEAFYSRITFIIIILAISSVTLYSSSYWPSQ